MAIIRDVNSEALTEAFSFSREKERAMYGLKGILAGVVADKELNEKELLFLDAWLKSQDALRDHEDVLIILKMVGEVLEDGQITRDELDAMQQSIESIVAQSQGDDEAEGLGKADELVGFLTGVASDGILNDEELGALTGWLNRNESIRDKFPASVIVNRLNNIVEDGIMNDEERQDLLETVQKITGTEPDAGEVSYEASTEVWEDDVEDVKIAGAVFCLSGEFVSGDRNHVDTNLRLHGAQTSPNVSSDVDYLVIGTLASRDWLYTSHGRKIEKAILLKRKGAKIAIITERTLLKYLG